MEQRLGELGEIGRLREPVVHLGVDVHRVLAVPWRRVAVVPESLQRRRLAARAARGDQQIATEVEEERVQSGIAALLGAEYAPIRRHVRYGSRAEPEADAP